MSVTMFPSGGIVTPGWRPTQTTSNEPGGVPQTATQVVNQEINGDNWLKVLQDKANSGDPEAMDKLINYYMSEASSKTARDWTAEREDSAYQRLFEDLKKAGVSPYILSGATPGLSASQGNSYSGNQFTSKDSSQRSADTALSQKGLDIFKGLLTTMLTASFYALLFAL